ncbi:MAG: chemotaxis-specific protein-glutamate methyltransferase CheB [Candidatus Heimdallarchaeota archaeon]
MRKIDVLIVDDSGFQRILLQNALRGDPRVGKIRFGRDGLDAVQKTMKLSPDVVILDIIMPKMDGIAALKEIMRKKPTPVLLLSALSRDQVDKALSGGLDGGAIDFLQKPTDKNKWLHSQQQILLRKVIAAAQANVKRLGSSIIADKVSGLQSDQKIKSLALRQRVIVFASSTGGPQALRLIFSQFPQATPPILAIQHMAEGFTNSLAKSLNSGSKIQVKEAQDGFLLQPSTALVAPGGDCHMNLSPKPYPSVSLMSGPLVNFVRPAADVTMTSATNIYGTGVLGVILTGMGSDGLEGAWAIKNGGGKIIAEAPESCVVKSMPSKVIDAGLADLVVPKEEIAAAIRQLSWF